MTRALDSHTASPNSIVPLKTWLTRPEAAAYCTDRGATISKTTLAKFATEGGGPSYRRFGNKALYTVKDLDKWIKDRLSPLKKSTSDVANGHRQAATKN